MKTIPCMLTVLCGWLLLLHTRSAVVGLTLIALAAGFPCPVLAGETEPEYDVVVYGATLAGIAAAVNAAEEGMSVALVERHSRIGGMHASGMGNVDAWSPQQSITGFFLEFLYENGRQNGREDRAFPFLGGKAALAAMQAMLAAQPVDLFARHRLTQATTQPGNEGRPRMVAFRAENLVDGETRDFTARIFIDATYEGDLLAAAGAGYRIGSEGKNVFNEPSAPAESNDHVMGYNFRVLVTKNADNRIPFNKPEGYNPDRDYPKLIAAAEGGEISRAKNQLIQILPAAPGKANLNDYKSSKYEGFNLYNESDEWPEGTPERRREIHELAEFRARSFFYFLANDERLPGVVREEMAQYGYPRDEFVDNGHFPPWLYVREGRRLNGIQTVTELDYRPRQGSKRSRAFPGSIAVGHFPMNSHGTHIGPDGEEHGNFLIVIPPFQVPYGVMIPQKVDGLIVPVAVSASQLAFSAIRMEPSWTAMGHAAGVAAADAIKGDKEPRDLDVKLLQEHLWNEGLVTFFTLDVRPDSPYFRAVQYFGNRGMFQDLHTFENPDSQKEGSTAGHNISPELALEPALADAWIAFIKNQLGAELSPDDVDQLRQSHTRGAFLNLARRLVREG